MADNEISITVSNRSQNIDINTGESNNQIGISGDNSQNFSNEARKSAERAAQSATEAEQSATNAQTVYEDLQEFAGQTLENLNNTVDTALTNIDNTKTEVIANINSSTTTSIENIETETDGSISEITTAKDNAIAEINATGINSRANIDLSNLSNTGQSKFDEKVNVDDMVEVDMVDISEAGQDITSLVMPDYTAGISIATDVNYTPVKDGWISYIPGIEISNNVGWNACRITIDGQVVYSQAYSSGNNGTNADGFICPVSKDSVCLCQFSAGIVNFYPCKGGN